MYVLSSKLDVVHFSNTFLTAPKIVVLFSIVFCRTEHIEESSLHNLLLSFLLVFLQPSTPGRGQSAGIHEILVFFFTEFFVEPNTFKKHLQQHHLYPAVVAVCS